MRKLTDSIPEDLSHDLFRWWRRSEGGNLEQGEGKMIYITSPPLAHGIYPAGPTGITLGFLLPFPGLQQRRKSSRI